MADGLLNFKDYGLQFGDLEERQVTTAIVIHTIGSNAGDKSVVKIHEEHQNIGYSGCGYNYLIRYDGTIEVGRPEWAKGAHTEGHNWHSLGIVLSGSGDVRSATEAQIKSLINLCAMLCKKYKLPSSAIHAHLDYSETACPGKMIAPQLWKYIAKVKEIVGH